MRNNNTTTPFFALLLTLFCLAFTQKSDNSTHTYPQGYFRSPVNHTIRLAGTFGELRPNHFHSGIDIKSSNGSTGDPLFAAAEGYVSRVKVQSGSYGNALYIAHPNGYTTVYAHLENFTPELAKWIKKQQYERESFEVDLYPSVNQFTYTKGQKIGKMGLSGRSYGPHLHFEIRESGSEKPVNPLLFGFDMTDTQAPKMHQVRVYNLNDKHEETDAKTYELYRNNKGQYRIKGDTMMIGAWRAGLALKVYDHHNGVTNWNGVYTVNMQVDNAPYFETKFEKFSFSETRNINAHIDYCQRVTKKAYFNRCFKMPGNNLSMYKQKVNNGVIELSSSQAKKITMISSDADGNVSELVFWVKRAKVEEPKSELFNYVLPWNEDNVVKNNSLYLKFPKGTFYETLYMQYHSANDQSNGYYSSVHQVHNYKTPVHKYYEIGIRPVREIPAELQSKAFVAYCDNKGKYTNCGGKWNDGKLFAKVRDLGDFMIMIDNTPPTIEPVSVSSNMATYKNMSFRIKDNMRTARNVDGLSWRASIDDKWILMEYDAKNDLLTHRFDTQLAKGKHEFRLVLSDNRGNTKVYERAFTR